MKVFFDLFYIGCIMLAMQNPQDFILSSVHVQFIF